MGKMGGAPISGASLQAPSANPVRWEAAIEQPTQAETNGINTLNEKSLHAALKRWYAQPGDRFEVRVDGYIIDLVRGDLLIEVQTGGISPLKRKLAALTRLHPVRLVIPIAQEKWIVRLPKEGDDPQGKPVRRKSPRRGQVEHLFKELVFIPGLMAQENFSLEVLLTREEEVRRFDEGRAKAWRRKGWVIEERRLLEVVDRRVFETPASLAALLPAALPDPFTVPQAAAALAQPAWLARKMVYCLRALDAIEAAGKQGRAVAYRRKIL